MRMRDKKALHSALLLKQYCLERPCNADECAFLRESGICPLKESRMPACWNLDGLKPRAAEKERDAG